MKYFDANEFRRQGHETIDRLADFLDESTSPSKNRQSKVIDFQHADALFQQWRSGFPGMEDGSSGSYLKLLKTVIEQSIRLHHPNFLGHQISPTSHVSALAGVASDLLNNGMGVYEMGMAGTVMERRVVELVAGSFGFPDSAGGVLTSGGSLGNLTALLTARNQKMPELLENGISDRKPALMVSEQAHYCVQRSVAVMGWGKSGLIKVPVNERYQLDIHRLPDLLNKANSEGRRVVALVGSACSTATGSYDDLQRMADFCRSNDLWFHIDGAHGAAVTFSNKFRELLAGIERADSVVMDFHKMLLTPALATALVFRDNRHAYGTFQQTADYLFSEEGRDSQWHNIALRSFECTKYMMSLKVCAILAEHGVEAWDRNVTGLFETARTLANEIRRSESMELLCEPEANIVCYRFTPEKKVQANEVNQRIRERLLSDGTFYVVQSTINGELWLRSTIGNVLTAESNIRELIQEVTRLGAELESEI